MKKNVFIKTAIPLIIAIIMIGGNVSYSQQKAQAVPKTVVATTSHTYEVNGYLEAIDIYPLKGTAVGINTGFIGGSVELPFDITSYNTLELFTLTVANQRAWRQYSQRRFWDTPDGITMMLVFKNSDQDAALEDAEEIEAMIESVYDMNLALVAGEREAASRKTTIIFQGSMSIEAFANYTSEFCDYVSDEGLGKAVDETLLDDAPVKAMSIGLLNGDFNLEGIIDISGWIPVINAAWIDPNGLEQTGTQITMSVDNILPTLGTVEGADNSIASFVTMNLPYVVDLQSCEPETDNDYPQYARRFEWILKVDIPLINWTLDRHYDDIEVVYDLNITDLIHYPQVIGTMEITNELPLEGNEDLTYEFTFENVGDETAYDITMAYGEFANANLGGFNFTVNNPELVFDENQLMYYDNDTGILSTDPTGAELTIDGWFKWISNSSWLKDGDVVSEEFFDVELGEIIYTTTTALTIDSGDFDLVPIMENDTPTNTSRLETTINEIAPGDNVTVSFTIENLPGGVFNVYNAIKVGNTIDLYIEESFAIEDILIEMFKLSGSTLHIPEDQKTWANWFPQPVSGSAFTYVDAEGEPFMGLTNGLVIQLYDDEAVLVGKLTLDRDVYRIGDDDVTYTLELTNIGNAPATDIDYQLYHGFINDNFDLGYVKRIPNTKGSIEIINPGETETVQLTGSVYTHVGLHPVFAEFGYNSSETLDLDHPLIFSQCRHQAVYSNLDFGFVLPPLNDEGSTKPIYPTPEVEVETELLGLTNETTIGDTLTFRTTITNVGTEETNIIYIQRLPRALEPPSSEEEVNITIDGIPVTDYSVIWDPNPAFGMPLALIGEDFNQQGAFGIPLGVDETMVIEIDVTVRSAGDIYIPPTEIRYRSQYNMSDTNAPQQPAKDEARSIPAGLQTQSNDGIIDPIFSIEDTNPDIAEDRTTNDWGSYSDSLSIVIEELTQFGGKKLLYIGIGIVGITGVAVLIYFTTNGKK